MKLNKTIVGLEDLAIRLSPSLGFHVSRRACAWLHNRGHDDRKRNLQPDEIIELLGPRSAEECHRIARASLVHRHLNRLANQLIERKGLDAVLPFIEWENKERIDQALASEKSAIITCWHAGPYLSITAALKSLAIPMLKVVAVKHFETPPGWEIHEWNRQPGEGVVVMKRALKWLRQGKPVFIAMDGTKDPEYSARLPFMGRMAYLEKAIGALWEISGSPVVPLSARWDDARLKIIIRVHDLVTAPAAGTEIESYSTADRVNIQTASRFAEFIQNHPEEISLRNFRTMMKFEKIAGNIGA